MRGLTLLGLAALAAQASSLGVPTLHPNPTAPRPAPAHVNPLSECTEHFFKQRIDHFTWRDMPDGREPFYMERYFLCNEKAWNGSGPVFFYTGNEGPVELYINNTGLMFEHANEFGALIMFGEHRYFGESHPFGKDDDKYPYYCSMEQALADYAYLITSVIPTMTKAPLMGQDLPPIITFGGSYGGMLTTFFRYKYPHIVAGGIAGSAPIRWFYNGTMPTNAYLDNSNHVITEDATAKVGKAAAGCDVNVRSAFKKLFELGKTESGRQTIREEMNLCNKDVKPGLADELAGTMYNAFFWMAMGNYPYPSSYMTYGHGDLPPWPMRVACDAMMDHPGKLLQGLAQMGLVYLNVSGTETCFPAAGNPHVTPTVYGWTVLACSEVMLPMGMNGVTDMFWNSPPNFWGQVESCKRAGFSPRPKWLYEMYGGWNLQDHVTNVVFSNGEYDPWSSFGARITTALTPDLLRAEESVVSFLIKEGGHHLDLMWANPADPHSVLLARQVELAHIRKWISQYNSARANRE